MPSLEHSSVREKIRRLDNDLTTQPRVYKMSQKEHISSDRLPLVPALGPCSLILFSLLFRDRSHHQGQRTFWNQ